MCVSLLLNIILILSTTKKASKLSLYYRLRIYVLMVSVLAIAFKISRPIIFSAVKKVNFLWSRNFSSVKELSHSGITSSQSRNFSRNKKVFLKKKKKYLIKEIFYKQESFLQTKTFSDQGSSPQLNIFRRSRQFSGNKDQKGLTFLTLKIQKGFTF